MANEFVITDLVDKKAVQQLKELRLEFDSTKGAYVALAKELAQGVKTNPKTFDELSQKARNYTSLLEKLNKTQENMASIQAKQLTVLRQVSQQLNSMSSLQKLNLLFEQFAKNIKNASDMLAGLSSTSNQVASAQDNAAKSTQTASDTISQASAQLQAANMNYASIIDTVQAYDGEVTKLTADTIANKEAMKQILADIKALEKSYKDGNITLSEYTRQSALLKQRHTELMAQNQQYSALIKNHSTAIISASGSYYEMNAAMLELQKRYKALSEADRESSIGKNLITQANALNDKLKEIDAKFGNYQRNVGNYASSWNGLNVQTQQLLRELPSLTMSFNQFFLAISNNLPMFADELKRASEEFKSLKAQGKEAVPVWKQLLGNLFSWQSALVIGITLLSAYGNEVIGWVASLFKGKKALEETTSAYKQLEDARRKGISDSVKERAELDLLYNATQNNKRSMKERIAAVDELQNKYPSYFEGMDKEQILAGKAATSYENLKNAIIATAQARAISEKVYENASLIIDMESKRNSLLVDRYQIQKEINQLEEYSKKEENKDYITAYSSRIKRLKDEVDDINDKLSISNTEIDNAKKRQESLISSIDITALVNDPGKNDKAYEEQKRKAEEYAEYIKRITEDLSKSRIELIADGREREIAEINKEYEDKIKEIKGNSEKETELRKNLEILKNKAIAEVNNKYDKELLEIEKTNLENRLASIGESSNEELNKRLNIQIQLNNMMRDAEIKDAERNGEDVVAIRMKYMQRENSLIVRTLQERIGLIEASTDRIVDRQETSSLEEANIVKKQYAEGEISKEDYEKKLYDIGVKYSKARLQALIKEVESEMSLLDPADEKYQDLEDRLANLQAQIDGISYDDANKKREEWADKFKEGLSEMNSAARDSLGETAGIFEGLSDIIADVAENGKLSFEALLKSVGKIVDGITSLMTDIYDARIENIEKEQDANDEAYDKEIERIEALEENGAISKEEAELRKRAAEDKTAAKNEELEKKKAALQEKQARWDKANSIVQAGIATALAITKALPNLVLAALVGAMGAAQVAIIAAQSIPKYAKGTKDHPGGLAIVGDGGKKEGIVTDNGLFITPDKPTLVDIPAHAQVIPDLSYIYDRRGLASDYGLLEQRLKNMREEGVVVNVSNDYSRLEKKMESNTKQLQSIGRMMKKANQRADYNWISNRV
jgi:DNA repair exonuclease SbcCD ATPase subunit|nr:MAG TPA: tail tape measure protein [Caudoviricetes sp.]